MNRLVVGGTSATAELLEMLEEAVDVVVGAAADEAAGTADGTAPAVAAVEEHSSPVAAVRSSLVGVVAVRSLEAAAFDSPAEAADHIPSAVAAGWDRTTVAAAYRSVEAAAHIEPEPPMVVAAYSVDPFHT